MKTRAYAIVRQDISGDSTDEHVERIRELAAARRLNLRGVLIAQDDARYGLLLASFSDSRIETLLLPSVLHVTGWLVAIRCQVEVLTLDPPKRWDRLPGPHTDATAG